MEVISCSGSQIQPPGGIIMDEMLRDDIVVEETTVNELVLKPELDGLSAEKPSTIIVMEETQNLGNNAQDESSSPTEPKWLQQDEPIAFFLSNSIALWVKVMIIIIITTLYHHLSLSY